MRHILLTVTGIAACALVSLDASVGAAYGETLVGEKEFLQVLDAKVKPRCESLKRSALKTGAARPEPRSAGDPCSERLRVLGELLHYIEKGGEFNHFTARVIFQWKNISALTRFLDAGKALYGMPREHLCGDPGTKLVKELVGELERIVIALRNETGPEGYKPEADDVFKTPEIRKRGLLEHAAALEAFKRRLVRIWPL